MNISRHNSDFAFSGLDNSRAVRSNKTSCALSFHHLFNSHHIKSRNSLSNTNNKWDFGSDSFFNGCTCSEGRYINNWSFSMSLLDRFNHSSEDWESKMRLASFARIGATNDVCSISNSLFGVEGSVFTSESLHKNFRVSINKNLRHSFVSICKTSCSKHRICFG